MKKRGNQHANGNHRHSVAPFQRAFAAACAAGIASAMMTASAHAGTYYADDTQSLIAAITQANNFSGSTIDITSNITLTDSLLPGQAGFPLPNNQLPEITGNTTITSGGSGNYTISGGGHYRIFFVNSGTATVNINNLNLVDGLAQGGNGGYGENAGGGGGGMGAGGALFIDSGHVLVSGVMFAGNQAIGGNSGGYSGSTAVNSSNGGGGGGMGNFGGGGTANPTTSGAGGGPSGGTAGNTINAGGSGGDFSGGGGGVEGGMGGFGGGGGGAPQGRGAGSGGFGGGGGAGDARGGFGGGNATNTNGGGGLGAGGAIFVRSGGSLSFAGSGSIATNSVIAGNASSATYSGQALGSGIFVQGSSSGDTPLIFAPAAGQTITVSDSIADTGGGGAGATTVDMNGGGTLVLTGMNTYSGGTVLNSGVVAISSEAALGSGGITFNGGTLQLNGNYFTSLNLSAPTGGAVQLGAAATSLFSGVISGTGGLTYEGPGVLNLTNAQTYSGATQILGGTLAINAGPVQYRGSINNSDSLTVGFGATFDISQLASRAEQVGFPTVDVQNLSGAGTIALGGVDLAVTLNGGGVYVFSGTINGHGIGSPSGHAGALITSGPDTLTLSGQNSYSGGTQIDGGTLAITQDAALGTGPVAFNGGTLQLDGYTSQLNFNNQNVVLAVGNVAPDAVSINSATLAGNISGTSSLTYVGGGRLILTGQNSYSGGTQIDGGTLAITQDAALGTGPVVFNGGTLQLDGYTSNLNFNNQAVSLAAADSGGTGPGTATLAGNITGNSSLVFNGPGTLILGGANDYTGGTTINLGTLEVAAGAFGTGAITLNGGTLQTSQGASFTQSIAFTTNGGTFDTNGNSASLGMGVTGTGGFTKVGLGQLTLDGQSSIGGMLNVQAGTLALGYGGGSPAAVSSAGVVNSGEIDIAAGQQVLVGTLDSTNAGMLSVVGDADVLGGQAELSFSGVLTNSTGGVIYSRGPATLNFSGGLINNGTVNLDFSQATIGGPVTNAISTPTNPAATTAGQINISGGSTAVFNGSMANNGTIQIDTGSAAVFNGKFSGGGKVTGGGTAFLDGQLAPGDPVITSFTNLVLQSANSTVMDIAGTTPGGNNGYDQIIVVQSLTFGGSLTVNLLDGFKPIAGQTFDLFNFAGATTSGTFNSITLPTLGSGLSWNTANIYSNGDVTVTPEPAALALFALGGLALLAVRRRQHLV